MGAKYHPQMLVVCGIGFPTFYLLIPKNQSASPYFSPASAAPPVIGLRTALENLQGTREHQRLTVQPTWRFHNG